MTLTILKIISLSVVDLWTQESENNPGSLGTEKCLSSLLSFKIINKNRKNQGERQ